MVIVHDYLNHQPTLIVTGLGCKTKCVWSSLQPLKAVSDHLPHIRDCLVFSAADDLHYLQGAWVRIRIPADAYEICFPKGCGSKRQCLDWSTHTDENDFTSCSRCLVFYQPCTDASSPVHSN